MDCFQCGKRLNNKWSYCPYCGVKVKNEFLNNLNDVFKKVFSGLLGGNMKVKSLEFKNPEGFQSSNNKPVQQRMLSMPDELVEPEVSINKGVNGLVIKTELPGVKSLKNVSLALMGESLEIKAVSKNKGYFKIVSVPSGSNIIDQSLNNDLLEVVLA